MVNYMLCAFYYKKKVVIGSDDESSFLKKPFRAFGNEGVKSMYAKACTVLPLLAGHRNSTRKVHPSPRPVILQLE